MLIVCCTRQVSKKLIKKNFTLAAFFTDVCSMIFDFSGSILYQPLLDILKKYPQGISEFEIIKELKELGYPEFDAGVSGGEKKLFESHFVLFHVLYSLRNVLSKQGGGYLSISCLHIRLFPHYSKEMEALGYSDNLAEYYLDWSNLYKTTSKELRSMLDGFWKKYLVNSQKQQALAVLGLSEPVDAPKVKKQYKKLAFECHPDRGGDTAKFQIINEAMETLSLYYS